MGLQHKGQWAQVICEYCTHDGTDKIVRYNVEFLKYGYFIYCGNDSFLLFTVEAYTSLVYTK